MTMLSRFFLYAMFVLMFLSGIGLIVWLSSEAYAFGGFWAGLGVGAIGMSLLVAVFMVMIGE